MRPQNLYQVRDTKAQILIGPVVAGRNNVALVRELEDHVNDPKHTFGKNPNDYELLELGVQDEETGVIIGYEQPMTILNLSQLLKVE